LLGAQQRFALLLDAFLFIDVRNRAEPFDHAPLSVAYWTRAAHEPAISSVGRSQAELDVKGLTSVDPSPPSGACLFRIVRMKRDKPSKSLAGPVGQARIVVKALIGVVSRPIGTIGKQDIRNRLRHLMELLLA